MKKLSKILKAFVFVLLAACAFRVFALYNDYRRHIDSYAAYSVPWYTDAIITVIFTVILAALISVVCFILNRMEKKKAAPAFIEVTKDFHIDAIYRQLKDHYPLSLTSAYSLENGTEDYDEDYQILCGESSAGKFVLYANCGDIIFDVCKPDGSYTHWHPANADDAVRDIKMFMDGKLG